jgi:hypothetical protein
MIRASARSAAACSAQARELPLGGLPEAAARGAATRALIGGALGVLGRAATIPSSGHYGDGYSGYGSSGADYNRYGTYGTRYYGSGYNGTAPTDLTTTDTVGRTTDLMRSFRGIFKGKRARSARPTRMMKATDLWRE